MIWIAILALGLAAGTVGGVVRFGSSIMLMPILLDAVGRKEALPNMSIAGLRANIARASGWWREIELRSNAVYCATAIPAAAMGARTLLKLEPQFIEAFLGLLFVAMVPIRRWLMARGLRIALWHLSLVGAGIGFLSGMVAST